MPLVSARPFVPVLLLLAVGALLSAHAGVEGDRAQSRLGRQNTWSARSSTGLALAGTWTATPDAATGTVTGTWTLLDAQGRTSARGTWSAAKDAAGWRGSWRAVAVGRTGEYGGTWSADVALDDRSAFAGLFELAVKDVVSGAWRSGGQSGAWSIRAFN